MEQSLKFKRLTVEGWRQFDSVEIDLHDNLTILTGANGAGKSTLLGIFAGHLGYGRQFLGTPTRQRNGGYSYLSGIFKNLFRKISAKKQQDEQIFGELEYSNGIRSDLSVPQESGVQYNISISNQQGVSGTHIDSHHPVSNYQKVDQIPTNIVEAQYAYSLYNDEVRNIYNGAKGRFSPIYRLKETLMSMALFGEGNSRVRGNTRIMNFYDGFIDVLRAFLPESIGFIDLEINPPDLVVRTKTGSFMIDASSGGMMALIDYAWRIYSYSGFFSNFVVTIDEPENHLHPSLQRSLMPSLLKAFPSVQFIVATHSPFIVSSVKDSNVYALRYHSSSDYFDEGFSSPESLSARVVSTRLDTVRKAATATEILREVLGVPATMPDWAHVEAEAILREFEGRVFDKASVTDLRMRLERQGLEEFYPSALAHLVGQE